MSDEKVLQFAPQENNGLVDLVWAHGLSGKSLKLTRICSKYPGPPPRISELYHFEEDWLQELDKGAFGVVSKAVHKASCTTVVVKSVLKNNVGAEYLSQNIERGIFGFMLDLSLDRPHKNVVKYLDFMTTPNIVYVVMEQLNGPLLKDAVIEQAPLTGSFLRRVIQNGLAALSHIEKVLIHRDVKLENFRFRTALPAAPLVLIDFGLTCPVEAQDQPRAISGTMLYMAPEVFSRSYGSKVDVWALGVMFYLMLTGKVPSFNPEELSHPGSMMANLLESALRVPELQIVQRDAVDLLRRFLTVDPDMRPAASEALHHAFLDKENGKLQATSGKGLSPGIQLDRAAFASMVVITGKSRVLQPTKLKRVISEVVGEVRSMSDGATELSKSSLLPIETQRVEDKMASQLENSRAGRLLLSSGLMMCAWLGWVSFGRDRVQMHQGASIFFKGQASLVLDGIKKLQGLFTPPTIGLIAGSWWLAYRFRLSGEVAEGEAVPLQDGPEHVVRKARRIKNRKFRDQMLGQIQMLAKQEWSVSAKDYDSLVKDVERDIAKQLRKEGNPIDFGDGPPLPPRIFMGGWWLLWKKAPLWKKAEIVHQTVGKIALVQFFSKNTLFLSDADITEDILNLRPMVAPHTTTANLMLAQRLGGQDLAFCDVGQAWARRRKATHSAFVAQIPKIAQGAVDEAQRLCARITAKMPFIFSSGEVDMIEEFRTILIQSIASALYSERFLPEEVKLIDEGLNEIFRVAVALDPFDFSDMFEHLPPHTWYKKEMDKLVKDVMAVHKKYFAKVLAAFDPRQPCSNVCEEYLKMQSGDPSSALSNFEVLSMMHNLFGAGVDSTSVSGPWTLAFLLNNHEVIAKVRQEVFEATEGGSRWLRREDIMKLPLLAACFKESVRMRPPFPFKQRMTGGEVEVVGGYSLPPFTNILCNMYVMNNLEENFEDALTWKPERWLDEGAKLYPRKLRIFGGGVRICPGAQLAYENVILLLGSIIQNFDIDTVGGTPPSLEMVGSAFSVPPEHYKLKVTVRRNSLVAKSHNTIAARAKSTVERAKSLANGLIPAARPASSGPPLQIFYCSTTGTAEQMALSLKSAASSGGFNVNITNLENDFRSCMKIDVPCIFVCSTYYNGAPPDSGQAFYDWLVAEKDGSLKGMRFAVFANGNSQYEHFNWMGIQVNKHLQRLGATELTEMGLGDASEDAETAWDIWQSGLLTTLMPEGSTQATDAFSAVDPICDWALQWVDSDTQQRIRRTETMARGNLTLESRSELRLDTSEGSCLELIYKVEDCEYKTAENLLLYPQNSEELVTAMAARLNPSRTQDVDRLFTLQWIGNGEAPREPPVSCPTTLRKVLTEECDLTSKPKKAVLRDFASFATDVYEREAMQVLLAPKGSEWYELKTAKGMTLLDFFTEYSSIALPVESFLTLLPGFRMQPRRYTISSSPLADPERLRLTVTMHEKLLVDGKVMNGLCTHWQRDMALGSSCRGLVQPSGFVPPEDPRAPIIMVGAGSGIAPIIAFAEMREALKVQGATLGQAVVFFGCRHPERDFIYADRLQAWVSLGVLSEVIPAFSRPSEGSKMYVQDAVESRGSDLADMFQQGAFFYICGATAMGASVKDALVNSRAVDSAEEIKDLTNQGRYIQELWS